MEKETWKPINYRYIKKHYMISNHGNVMNFKTSKILKKTLVNNGYYQVSLSTMDNKILKLSVHVLVQVHFGDKCPDDDNIYIVNHKDGIKTNNMYTNLEWTTYQGNYQHAREHGLINLGDILSYSKVKNEVVEEICNCLDRGLKNYEILDELVLPQSSYYKSLIIRIKTGKQWKHISDKHPFVKKAALRHYDDKYIDNIYKSIDSGLKLSEMCKIHNISKDDYQKFKKLVFFIRTRQCYKDISEKYSWWK